MRPAGWKAVLGRFRRSEALSVPSDPVTGRMFSGMASSETSGVDLEYELTLRFSEPPDDLVLSLDDDALVEFVFEPTLDDLVSV